MSSLRVHDVHMPKKKKWGYMKSFQLTSRRQTSAKVDFRPDADEESPFAELRRFSRVLSIDSAPPEDIIGVSSALDAYREYLYRKIFTGTSHDDFMRLDAEDPGRIDWLIAVAGVDAEHFRSSKK